MTIQWFPGHMAKARRQITEKLKLVDLIIELLDARLPMSSRNPMVDEIIGDKPRIVLLNKSDLADPEVTSEWVDHFNNQGIAAIPINAVSGEGTKQLLDKCQSIMEEKFNRLKSKGVQPRAIRAMIIGIPNVGKSSLINRLAKKNIAVTGDRPGVTKQQQWIKIGQQLELLDTPGILWPKFEDQQVGIRLAASGAIKDEIYHYDEIAFQIVTFLKERYGNRLMERYDLKELSDDRVEIIEDIGRRRGCVVSGGNIDFDKASVLLLREIRAGKLGKISFETPLDWISS